MCKSGRESFVLFELPHCLPCSPPLHRNMIPLLKPFKLELFRIFIFKRFRPACAKCNCMVGGQNGLLTSSVFLLRTEDVCRRNQASRALGRLGSPVITVEYHSREILSRCSLLSLQTWSTHGYIVGRMRSKGKWSKQMSLCDFLLWHRYFSAIGNLVSHRKPNRIDMINMHLWNLNISEDWRSACPASLWWLLR